jgi:hypothetical protein
MWLARVNVLSSSRPSGPFGNTSSVVHLLIEYAGNWLAGIAGWNGRAARLTRALAMFSWIREQVTSPNGRSNWIGQLMVNKGALLLQSRAAPQSEETKPFIVLLSRSWMVEWRDSHVIHR